MTSPKVREFFVLLTSIPWDEASDLALWTECEDVADISDQEFNRYLGHRVRQGKSDYHIKQLVQATSQRHHDTGCPLLSVPRQAPRSVPKSVRFASQPIEHLIEKSSQVTKTKPKLKPIPNTTSKLPQRVPINKRDLEKPSISRSVLIVEKSPLTNDHLDDLIPPEVDVLDLDDTIGAAAFANDQDSDSVSFFDSSDSDSLEGMTYLSIDAENHLKSNATTTGTREELKNQTRPGFKLDYAQMGLLPKELASRLPQVPVYKCEFPKCGFTTSDPKVFNFHIHPTGRLRIEQPPRSPPSSPDVS